MGEAHNLSAEANCGEIRVVDNTLHREVSHCTE